MKCVCLAWAFEGRSSQRRNHVKSYRGVRHRRAQLHSRLVQFPSEVKITDARNVQRSAVADDATDATLVIRKLQAVARPRSSCASSCLMRVFDPVDVLMATRSVRQLFVQNTTGRRS